MANPGDETFAKTPDLSSKGAGLKLSVLIVDDGMLARSHIEDLLSEVPDCAIVGSVDNGHAAAEAIRSLRPDLVIMDIQMPGRSGIDVLADIDAEDRPLVIFATAYENFAVRAFELCAVDYLLKPFDDARFVEAISKARLTNDLRKAGQITNSLRNLLNDPGNALLASAKGQQPQYVERLAVEMPGQIRVVIVSDIDYISASGHHAELHVGPAAYVIRDRMDHLETHLDPAKFFRIHRSSIVQLDRIVSLLCDSGGDYAAKLKNGVQLSVSRSRMEALEQRLGFPASH